MKKKCMAAVLESPERFSIREFSIPKVKSEDLLLKVEMVSICGSDRHLYSGHHSAASFPKILGHEFVGYIEEIGEKAAQSYHFKEGDRVTVEPSRICFGCEYCLSGTYQMHVPRRGYGVGLTCDKYPYLLGAYSQYIYIFHGSKIHKIDKSVPAEAACLSSVIGNGIRWVRTTAKLQCCESIAIIGAGAQGLATIIGAKEAGAKPIIVLGISNDYKKFEVAKKFGADYVINIEKKEPIAEVKKINRGKLADVVVECSGNKDAIKMATNLVRPRKRMVLVGLTGGKEVKINTDLIINREVQVIGGHGQNWDVEDAVRIINSKKYAIENIITHKFPLKDVEKAMKFFSQAPPECIRIGLIP